MSTWIVQSSIGALSAGAQVDSASPKHHILSYGSGPQGMVWGPFSNDGKTYFEINGPTAFLTEVQSRSLASWRLRTALRNSAVLRTFYRSNRQLIRNSSNVVIGLLPAFVISGDSPEGRFLGSEDPEAAGEIIGLE